uniref:NADH-ubiquinone oxidoreductase chain 3 n=1 Tax=Synalpheus microneptunus TaxID=1503767 RepID=A0A6H0DU46_9EUCA|nr:NADH dehydrogenase subunit 3 [Synalpheus microneptunus]QIS92008.1 NADH dehydrogenase subunit 3 [Synalpheus microneptunus]
MLMVSTLVCLSLALSIIIMIISTLISKKTINDREKNSPFECGFDPKGSARLPFSLRFFLIAIVFLIFDVEITLLLPLASIFDKTNTITWTMTGTFFLLILLAGLYHEWMQGALEWAE